MNTSDTRTESEKLYDAERDGTLYLKPQPAGDSSLLTQAEIAQQAMRIELAREADRIRAAQRSDAAWDAILDITSDPTNDGQPHDTPLRPAEEKIISTLFGPVRVVRSRDEDQRQERWNAILKKVAAMPEPDQREALGYMAGLLGGMQAARRNA